MKLFLSILAIAAFSTTMGNVYAVSQQKEVTIKLYHHKGLSLPDDCHGALVTGFLVAYNVVASKLDKPFAAMNLIAVEEYFEYENDNLASASTAWIHATFDVSCEDCSYNDDNEPPVMLFRNANDYLTGSATHRKIEQEMLHQLKDSRICSSFDQLRDLGLIYPTKRRAALAAAAAAAAAPPPPPERDDDTETKILFQQDVSVTMNNVNDVLADSDTCQTAFDEVLMASIQSVFANDSSEYVQAVTTDSKTFYSHEAAIAFETTSSSLRKKTLKDNMVLARGHYAGHMDLSLPTDMDFATMMHFTNTKDNSVRAARHGKFEQVFQENLHKISASSSCTAFERVSDVDIRFGGKHVGLVGSEDPVDPKDKDLNAEKVTAWQQPMVTDLEGVDMTIPPSDTCFAIFQVEMVSAFNRAHYGDDFQVTSNTLHSVDMVLVEKNHHRALEEDDLLGRNLNIHWSLRTFVIGKCVMCPSDNRDFPNFMLGSPQHTTFQSELLKGLQDSECPSFQAITGVGIEYVDSFAPHNDFISLTVTE